MKKKLLQIGVVVIVGMMITGVVAYQKKRTPERYSITYTDVFDTVTQITGYGENKEEFQVEIEYLHEMLKHYHELFDIYNSYDGLNNLKTINDMAGKAPVEVDEEIIELLNYGKEVYDLTKGKNNIAMGSVLRIWHTYRKNGIDMPQKAALPDMESLKAAEKYTDWNKVVIDEEKKTVYLDDENMSLDVGSIGKGYAVEKTKEYAKAKGIKSLLISVGGNVAVIGDKIDHEEWKVGIQRPEAEKQDEVLCYVKAKDVCVVTSGDYQRFYTVGGKNYCHIIDPESLMPSNYFRSVTIIAKDSAYADALSTGIFSLSFNEGKELVEGLKDVEAMWVLQDGRQKFSSGFQNYLGK